MPSSLATHDKDNAQEDQTPQVLLGYLYFCFVSIHGYTSPVEPLSFLLPSSIPLNKTPAVSATASVIATMKISSVEVASDEAPGELSQDVLDMARLGKAQQFQRNFNFWSTFGFVSIYMATWEFSIVSMSPSLPTTGYGGFFWTFIGSLLCYSSIVASLAEMSSMSPTAGGQYHWVSEFAPAGWQKQASYASGWMSSLGWISSLAGGVYVCADLVQVCINIEYPDFVFTSWQRFLVILVMFLVTIALNTLGARLLPAIEVVSLIGHVAGFVVFVGILWGMCQPLNGSSVVFLDFENNGGWRNFGTVCILNQVSMIWSMLGSDTIVHICEYLQLLSHVQLRHGSFNLLGLSRGSQRCILNRPTSHVVVICYQHRHGICDDHHNVVYYWTN